MLRCGQYGCQRLTGAREGRRELIKKREGSSEQCVVWRQEVTRGNKRYRAVLGQEVTRDTV